MSEAEYVIMSHKARKKVQIRRLPNKLRLEQAIKKYRDVEGQQNKPDLDKRSREPKLYIAHQRHLPSYMKTGGRQRTRN